MPTSKLRLADKRQKCDFCLLIVSAIKPDAQVYIGSATDTTKGCRGRVQKYDRRDVDMSRFVDKALNDDYVISHAGLFARIPIPEAATAVEHRILMLALEGTLCWAPFRANAVEYRETPITAQAQRSGTTALASSSGGGNIPARFRVQKKNDVEIVIGLDAYKP